eukprot:TRINITY_DN16723_c0_g1_i2.p1 TRINITY_DN16723_c0_g1~~TRINITY_DN16723_c0_g1_i2.p1  ORF type:complete len:559 (+),score=32.40 TRINITY_DN16723_c0_g1_i2:60-1679(+)
MCIRDRAGIEQIMFYTLDVYLFVVLVFLPDSGGILWADFALHMIHTFHFVCICGLKYAFFGQDKIEMLTTSVFSDQQKADDQVTGSWSRQTDKIIEDEIAFAVRDNEIDPTLFLVRFSTKPRTEALLTLLEGIPACAQTQNLLHISDSSQLYTGRAAAKYLIQFIKRSQVSRKNLASEAFSISISFIASILPHLLRGMLYYKGDILKSFGDSAVSTPGLIVIFCFHAYLWRIRTRFFMSTSPDMIRVKLALQHLTTMLTPQTKELKLTTSTRPLPHINYSCSLSVRSWGILRQIIFDYGKRFINKRQAYKKMFLYLNLATGVYVFMVFFQLISVETTMVFEVTALLDCILTILTSLRDLRVGAEINDATMKQIAQLQRAKLIHQNFKEFADYFTAKRMSQQKLDHEAYASLLEVMDPQIHESIQDPVEYQQHMIKLSKKAMNVLSNLIDDLNYQYANQKYHVLGVAATNDLITKIIWLLLSLTVAVAQRIAYSLLPFSMLSWAADGGNPFDFSHNFRQQRINSMLSHSNLCFFLQFVAV